MAPRENRLIHESSPYLLQHAHNPVNWFPWGPEALQLAQQQDKPILLSIGYAACHWCHVMERESFEDEDTAALMNAHYVSIKVDREERPDLDDIYMAATVAMTGQGGWPMTVFLTPDQRPFFAGTYFPPTDMHGRPGFPTLLRRVAEVWRDDRKGIEGQAGQLTHAVQEQLSQACPKPVADGALDQAARQLSAQYDARWGGFGGAPKFPPSAALHLLLRHHADTGDVRSLEMVRGTLDGMHNGGMFDHIGGGFARYSTDERWHVPHFEKMLYDNAQLARIYLEAFQVTGEPRYREVVTRTLDYLLREMQSPQGAFYSATDADSEGVEGKFFTFTPAQIREAVGEPGASALCAFYDVTDAGNWEGSNVLWTPRPAAEVAAELGLTEAQLHARVEAARETLYGARLARVAPLLDDKILTSWNALGLGSLAEAARVLGEPHYLRAAVRAADDLWSRLRTDEGRLLRTARGDKAHLDGYLEDYAYLGDALIDLVEAGADGVWLERSRALAEQVMQHFGSDSGAFHHVSDQHEALLTRSLDGQDSAVPNANAVAGRWLARLGAHLDDAALRLRAESALQAFGALIERAPRAFATNLCALHFLAAPPLELALVGPPGPARGALERAAAEPFLPRRILACGEASDDAHVPLLQGKKLVNGAPAAYLCRDFVCKQPLTGADELRAALRDAI